MTGSDTIVPHSSHYARRQAPASERSERCRRTSGAPGDGPLRFTRGTRKRAGPCPCRPEACTEGPKHSEGSEVRRPVPSLRPTRRPDESGGYDAGGWVGVGRERSEGPDGWG